MPELTMDEICQKIVNRITEEVLSKGSSAIPAGNNGPYYNTETNVRNMAHYCVSLAELYKRTKDAKYKDALRLLSEAVYASPHYLGDGIYRCRISEKTDEVNGTIGPAWIMEGLIYAGMVLKDEKYIDRAAEIINALPFNEAFGLWQRKNTDGRVMTLDTTFNHQLWLAAMGALLIRVHPDEELKKRLQRFTNRLPANITIRKNGRIGHFTLNDQNGLLGYPGKLCRDLKSDINEALKKPSFAYKETGYHSFNLYGFAILKENADWEIPFFDSKEFKKSIDYIYSPAYYGQLSKADRKLDCTRVSSKLSAGFNVFSYSYNAPAFELPYILKCFRPGDTRNESLLTDFAKMQLQLTYDPDTESFSKNTDDPVTLTCRIYEYLRASTAHA